MLPMPLSERSTVSAGLREKVGAEFYRAQRSTTECLAESLRLRHLFDRGDGLEFVQPQFRKLDAVKS